MFGPPSRSTLCFSVLPRVSTREVLQDDRVGERAEDLGRRDAALHQVDDVGLGEHAALRGDVVELRVVEVERRHELRRRRPTLIMHLSMVAPVPDAHLSFIDGDGGLVAGLLVLLEHDDLGVLPAELDDAEPTSGCRCSTASVTALTSCTNLPPVGARERRRARAGEEDAPRRRAGESGNAAAIASSSSSTFSGCFVWWRW